jgi:hypothetical protein
MNHRQEKGIIVNPTERATKIPSRRIGVFAALRAFLGVRGSGVPSASNGPRLRHGRLVLLPLVSCSLLVAVLLGMASPAVSAPESPTAYLGSTIENILNIGASSARLSGTVKARGLETRWRFESAASALGPWTAVSGASGTISTAEANSGLTLANSDYTPVGSAIFGLAPGTVYYVRLIAENEDGTENSEDTLNSLGVPEGPASFETAGPPRVSTFATHTFAAGGETIRVLGSVTPDTDPIGEFQTVTIGGAPTGGTFTLTFEGQTTTPIPYDAEPGVVQEALQALPSIGGNREEKHVFVEGGNPGGPYEVRFFGPKAGVALPQITADASGLTPSGTVTVVTLENGSSYDTHYHFEYVSQAQFERSGPGGGWAGARSTPEVDLGAGKLNEEGFASRIMGVDLPGLEPGVAYRYRLTATNTTVGDPVVHGQEETVVAPGVSGSGPGPVACPNEALRTGPSAHLPDCRAYEQVTPVEKGGTTEIEKYGAFVPAHVYVGEDGDHFLLESSVTKWGPDPGANESDYLFSRDPVKGWVMTSATPPAQGVADSYVPGILNSDVTQAGLEVGWNTRNAYSPDVSLVDGPLGGPYEMVTSMPRSQVPGESEGAPLSTWVAASADFSKLVLWTEDHKLLGFNTGTMSGKDLYEYSEGQVRQLNVDSAGMTIGSCGAQMVEGFENKAGGRRGHSSSHAVSADGARVFFEAAPGSECPTGEEEAFGGPRLNLYMRVNGTETVDLGADRFLAADAEGRRLLLEHINGATHEFVLYDTETKASKFLFTPDERFSKGEPNFVVSEDFTALYFESSGRLVPEAPSIAAGSEDLNPHVGTINIYRYDLAGETLSFIAQIGAPINGGGEDFSTTPDGRDLYFISPGVAGVPGGAPASSTGQVYRYDGSEGVVQCMSCASSFDPEPKLNSLFAARGFESGGTDNSIDGVPAVRISSANGDYVFFDALSALVPSDVNGEVDVQNRISGEYLSSDYSVSSDVYEWRRDGVGGCVHVQGCLSLISSGQGGGHLVMLLGTTGSGRDVFFTTNAPLVGQDKDTASDVYDARVGGGFSEATRPVECEGDACSTPFAAPSDLTPASATFQGAGDILESALPEVKPQSKPTLKKKKTKKKKKKGSGGKAKAKRKAKKAGGRKTGSGAKAENSNARRGR